MVPTTRISIQQSIDAVQAEHWKVQGAIPEDPTTATIPIHDDAAVQTLNEPHLEPTPVKFQPRAADNAWDTGNIAVDVAVVNRCKRFTLDSTRMKLVQTMINS